MAAQEEIIPGRGGRAARAVAWVLGALAALGAVLQLSVKDRWPVVAILFYALPLPVVAALLGALAGALGPWMKRRRPALAALLLAGAALGWWLGAALFLREGAAPPGGVQPARVLFWNANRGNLGPAGTARAARAAGADLAFVVEFCGGETPEARAAWRKAFAGYNAVFPGEKMAIFSRGEVEPGGIEKLDDGSYAARARVSVSGRPVNVILVDIRATLTRHRGPALARLAELVRESPADGPLLVLGDFNTPRNSALLAPLRAELVNAFETAGRGLDATWPVPLPVHAIDQVWVGRALRAAGCRHFSTWRSDHRQVLCELWAEPAAKKRAAIPRQKPEAKPKPKPLKLITWNIQYGREEGADLNSWPARKGALAAALAREKPAILCVQEALAGQLEFIDEQFAGHRRVGAGRDDGKEAGEHAAIFYDGKRFAAVESGTFWLSDAPEKPGRTWANRYVRICTRVRLREKPSGRTFRVYNTHFPLNAPARAKSAELMVTRIRAAGAADPVILCGDFNCGPGSGPWNAFARAGLANSEKAARGRSGTATFHKFGIPLVCLDAVFVSGGWRVTGHRVVSGAKERVYPSDHFGVAVALELEAAKK